MKKSELTLLFESFVEKLKELYETTKPLTKIELFTYPDAMKYFVEQQSNPANAKASKGALLRVKDLPEASVVHQFLMDDNNNILSNRSLRVMKFDDELEDAFGEEDLLIVQ
ncbi:MAG: hypothetical protein HOP11_15590 [Saprospiraceae bacterium]|nr:hypothetical protein [Saprospiraceae bacterium]